MTHFLVTLVWQLDKQRQLTAMEASESLAIFNKWLCLARDVVPVELDVRLKNANSCFGRI